MRRFFRTLAVFALAIVLFACAGVAWFVFADRSLPAGQTDVEIDKGMGLAEIGARLQQQGVIRSADAFRIYVHAARSSLSIEAAQFTFVPHETLPQVVDVLAAGGRPLVVWVTIPEGYTVRQIGHRLSALGLFEAADFDREALNRSLVIDGERTKNLEGYLFPDTYSIPRETTPATVAGLMTDQFRKELPRDYRTAARRLHYTIPQIVTIASLIEREAKVDGERALMAGVYYNRLRLGMPLEVDATIEYALPNHKTALSYGDLAIESPYNTYRHVGLPPTPIANPGKASIFAAFHPARTDFLYYVYMGHGHHKFSRTLQEQQQAEQQFLH